MGHDQGNGLDVANIDLKGLNMIFAGRENPFMSSQKQGNIHSIYFNTNNKICWNNEQKQGFW